jgi:hypothetical protein
MRHVLLKEKGNALFLILIAVALFAALTYAITQSGKGSGGGTSKEQAVLVAAQITQYAGELQQAVSRLLLSGCTVAKLSFDSTKFPDATTYDNTQAPADHSCDIFDPVGGGVTWQAPPSVSLGVGGTQYIFTGAIGVMGVGTDNSVNGKDDKELMMVVFVPRDICLQVNQTEGAVNTGGSPPQVDDSLSIPLQSWMTWSSNFFGADPTGYFMNHMTLGDTPNNEAPELLRHAMGCYEAPDHLSGVHHYYFYDVLLVR